MIVLAVISLGFALLPAILYFRNVAIFRPPPDGDSDRPAVSVLIPARNEESSIAACLESVLASRNVDLECIVLDDGSTDRTAEIVRAIALKDPRVRLEAGVPLPNNWSGKQHACYRLSQQARMPFLTFLDADVRLTPNAIARMAAFQKASNAALTSGFPRQITGTVLEKLVIPLIHFLLLGFLPFGQMRKKSLPGLGAGCGQWFFTTREAYDRVGGHANPRVRSSFHDGIQLPRAYRQAGLMTDLCDVTDLASCRMYSSAGQVWNGLAKNAREGLAAPKMILFTTLLLVGGQVLPLVLLASSLVPIVEYDNESTDRFRSENWLLLIVSSLALLASYAPRIDAVIRFRQSLLGAIFHPVGVLILIAIQWYAAVRAIIGKPVGWKGRPLPSAGS